MGKHLRLNIQDSKIAPWMTATLFWILLVGIAARFWHLHQSAWYATLLIVGMLVAAFIAGDVVGGHVQFKNAIGSVVTNIRQSGNFVTFLCVLAASLIWWRYLGRNNIESVPRIIAISLAGFIVGALIGFLFSSYSAEEERPIGKIRDWLLAGITGVTLVNAAKIKAGVDYLAGTNEQTKSIVYCMLVVYLGLGFLLMFFQRELILNVIVARARIERVQIQNTQQTSIVLQRAMAALPPSLLSGIQDADEIVDESKKEQAKRIRELLYSSDVNTFLEQAEASRRSGSTTLSWDVISKVAYVNYYRSYFEDAATKATQVTKAIEWITSALQLTPLHAELTMKLADMYAMSGEYSAAVAVLEELTTRPECPALAQQWLGYFLLYIPGREHESINYCDRYLSLFASDADTHLNKARAYAQLFAIEYRKGSNPVNEKNSCIAELTKALQLKPSLYNHITIVLPSQQNYSFAALEDSSQYGAEFKKARDLFAPKASMSRAAGATGSTPVTTP